MNEYAVVFLESPRVSETLIFTTKGSKKERNKENDFPVPLISFPAAALAYPPHCYQKRLIK